MCSYSLGFIEEIEIGKYICKTRNHRQTRQTDFVYRIPLAAGSRSEGRGAEDKSGNIGIVMVGACRA